MLLEINCVVDIGIVPPIFTPGIKSIEWCSKLGGLYSLFVTEIAKCSLHINNYFDEQVNKFDLNEAPAREEKNI